MIEKVDIERFGLFRDFDWATSVGRNHKREDILFKKLNIIYGRNYSGKTTLSRIFRCLEQRTLHEDYPEAKFSVRFKNGPEIRHDNLTSQPEDLTIRVYNTDFVKENLSWLYSEDGKIEPFTILGARNVGLEEKIRELDQKLGNEEEKTGLLGELSDLTDRAEGARKTHDNKFKQIENGLRQKAKEIKTNASLFNQVTYQINSIKRDIIKINSNPPPQSATKEQLKSLLGEKAKEDLSPLPEKRPQLGTFIDETRTLLETTISLSNPISDLLEDAVLQAWVREGMELHIGEKESCKFCGNKISPELWEKLGAHFNQESEELKTKIEQQIKRLAAARDGLEGYIKLTRNNFYSAFQSDFDTFKQEWDRAKSTYVSCIESLVASLGKRNEDIFTPVSIPAVTDVSEEILSLLKRINQLITKNNEKTSSLSKEKSKAREQLRLREVQDYTQTIQYDALINERDELKEKSDQASTTLKNLELEIRELKDRRRNLEAEAKDESRGAELINKHLAHYFGHQELKLEASGEAPNLIFQIVRGDELAKNLSEGERSLISFCYFVAMLEDELKDPLAERNLIIYIDDPISSLDSNHIFFIYSLIEGVINRQVPFGNSRKPLYSQLFISTHSLAFLKYLQKLTQKGSQVEKFLIRRNNSESTEIVPSPSYLKKYITEFNYLFSEIYQCSIRENEEIEYYHIYGFGNNLRKFLEAYLFYKYPDHSKSLQKRMKNFFNDPTGYQLVNRFINEYSHLEEYVDRAMEPIEVSEVKRVANYVMDKIEQADPDQFASLLGSINSTD